MTAKTQSTSRAARSGLPPNTGSGTSPLLPKHLAELFVSPRSFFSGRPALEHSPAVLLVGCFYGMANAIERVAMELLRSELGRPRPAWEILRPFVAEQWAGFWLWVLVSGALGGIFLWWVGGWWYHLRLRWSGARDPDKRLARLTLVYSSFVFAGPAVIAAIIQTLVYSNYATAYAASEWFSLVLTLFLFWSVATSYSGVTTLFSVTRWKAAVWFLVLPAVIYVVGFGVGATLLTLVGGRTG